MPWEALSSRPLAHVPVHQRPTTTAARHFFRAWPCGLDPDLRPRLCRPVLHALAERLSSAGRDREPESERAFEAAGQGLMVDDRDPAAHWAMGRALWLRGGHDAVRRSSWSRAVDLSPNFALGHYALSFVHSQSGDPRAAIRSSDHSRHLPPFDPMLFGMLGRAPWPMSASASSTRRPTGPLKAAARPNAHIIILAIAAHCLALGRPAGRGENLRRHPPDLRATAPMSNT